MTWKEPGKNKWKEGKIHSYSNREMEKRKQAVEDTPTRNLIQKKAKINKRTKLDQLDLFDEKPRESWIDISRVLQEQGYSDPEIKIMEKCLGMSCYSNLEIGINKSGLVDAQSWGDLCNWIGDRMDDVLLGFHSWFKLVPSLSDKNVKGFWGIFDKSQLSNLLEQETLPFFAIRLSTTTSFCLAMGTKTIKGVQWVQFRWDPDKLCWMDVRSPVSLRQILSIRLPLEKEF